MDAPASVLATAKHYVGDGGTTGGDEKGNTEIDEAELRAVRLPPFQAAIERGVGSVMISYSSWNDVKMDAHQRPPVDVLPTAKAGGFQPALTPVEVPASRTA